MAAEMLSFQQGPYGEIYPLPLVPLEDDGTGETVEDIFDIFVQGAADMGAPLERIPERGASREGMLADALSVVDGWRRAEALDGELTTPAAVGLRHLVVNQGYRMSMRPLGMEFFEHVTFRPVFGRAEDGWRLGEESQGRTQLITVESPGAALREAMLLYATWVDEEQELFQKSARDDPNSLTATYYALLIEQLQTGEKLELPNGWTLQRTRHDIYIIVAPEAGPEGEGVVRSVEASAAVVARAVVVMARSLKNPLVLHPGLLLNLARKCDERIPMPSAVESAGPSRLWRSADGWEFGYTAAERPRSGRWGWVARETPKGKLELAVLTVVPDKPPMVQLKGGAQAIRPATAHGGKEVNLAGKVLSTWEAADFTALATRPGSEAVGPLVWAMFEVLRELDKE